MRKSWDILPRPGSGSTADEVHLGVGRALTQWERLEYRMGDIFGALISPGQLSMVAAHAFGIVPASSGRGDMVIAAAKAFPFPETERDLQSELMAFLKEVNEYRQRRNEIAHGVAANVDGKGVLLLPAFYNVRKFPMPSLAAAATASEFGAVYMYGPAELLHYQTRFHELVARADAIVAKLEELGATCSGLR